MNGKYHACSKGGLSYLSSLEYSDNRRLGVDFVSCLPNHKFPVRVDSKKALAVVREFYAKKEFKIAYLCITVRARLSFRKLHKIKVRACIDSQKRLVVVDEFQ